MENAILNQIWDRMSTSSRLHNSISYFCYTQIMTYVALLRGINVGGNNKVDMKQLKTTFEQAGMNNVSTYINSGNVIFTDGKYNAKELTERLEKAIEQEFGFVVKVLLRDFDNLKKVVNALPDSWQNNDTMKCDVMFLWESIDTPEVVNQLKIVPDIDTVKYVDGTILWRVDRENVTRSGMMKLVGTDLYRQMTIRNCNTTRKLYELMRTLATE